MWLAVLRVGDWLSCKCFSKMLLLMLKTWLPQSCRINALVSWLRPIVNAIVVTDTAVL